MARGEWANTTKIIEAAQAILEAEHPMTLRQCFYRLVSKGIIQNSRADYLKLSRLLTKARNDGRISFRHLTDRSRPIYSPNVFENPAEYAETIKRAYRKDYWHTQPNYVEIWVEKDSVIGSIEPVTDELGVAVRVGRGFISTTRAHEIARHFNRIDSLDKEITVFYLGDFDPSGVEIEIDAAKRVEEQQGAGVPFRFVIERLAIHREDIAKFNLPPLRVKDSDPRSASFNAKHGSECVELDALPVVELRERIRDAVSDLIDWELWDRAVAVEKVEIKSILSSMELWKNLAPADPYDSERI